MAEVALKWVLLHSFQGAPKEEDFALEEEPVIFNLRPGEIIVDALHISVDPYMRWAAKPGQVIPGYQVGRVRVSYHKEFPEWSVVLCAAGWRTLTLVHEPEAETPIGPMVFLLPGYSTMFPASLSLGIFGIPGMAAYFGMLDRGKPTAGETVLVSAAGGCVGSIAGQLAKMKGCFVIGSGSTTEKCSYLKELGYDETFNYKRCSVDNALSRLAPGGIDLYFDNVGGVFSHIVIKKHMKPGGRVVMCGSISTYSDPEMMEQSNFMAISYKQLDIRGVHFSFYKDRYPEAMKQMKQWMIEDKLLYREHVSQGFKRLPQAFVELFTGLNIGKAVVRV